jgi:predicted RNase H-like nuclease (RuvC/YqgF family)
MEELGSVLSSLEEMVDKKGEENHALEAELVGLQAEVAGQEAELAELVRAEEEGRAARRLDQMMRKNRLGEQLKEQADLIDLLQLQIETFVTKTFPTLG